MTNMQPFCFEGNYVRTIIQDGEPWFVAKDICAVLELENTTRALSSLEDDELSLLMERSGGQNREMNIISESGLYNLIFKSRKAQAKAFRRWVTHDVLPSIRKTGSYSILG